MLTSFSGTGFFKPSNNVRPSPSTSGFTIKTRLVGPLNFLAAASEQGGISFGPDQDNYVKLVAVAQPNGQFLQFTFGFRF